MLEAAEVGVEEVEEGQEDEDMDVRYHRRRVSRKQKSKLSYD